MRIVALALCGALLTTGAALAAPADRAALLERLHRALPRISEMAPLAEAMSSEVREDLITQNPSKEVAVAPIADRFGACLAKMFETRDYVAAAVAAADKAGMTEAELLTVVTFYEDPAIKAMFASVGPSMLAEEEPDLDPALIKRLEAAGKDPAMQRFQMIMAQSSEDAFDEEAFIDEAVVCAADLDEAVDEAGLTYVLPEDEDEQ